MSEDNFFPSSALRFLKNNRLGSIATVSSSGIPQLAYVYYYFSENNHIYIGTSGQSRKIKNIKENDKIAFMVASEDDQSVLEMEGSAKIILGKEAFEIWGKIVPVDTNKGKVSLFPPLLQIDPKNIEIVEITIETFKYSDFAGGNTILYVGAPHKWAENLI